MDRRQALLSFLNSTLQTAGAVVLASSALPAAAQEEPAAPVEGDLKKRADQVACTPEPGNAGEEFTSFVNGGFRNGGGGGGGFRKGGFANGGGGGGGFRKGGFANGGFGNGGGGGGGFRKGGFANGGFRN